MDRRNGTFYRYFVHFSFDLFFVIIFYIMLLARDGKLSLITKEARGVANEIDMTTSSSVKRSDKQIIIGHLNLIAFLAFAVPAQARKSISLR